MKKYKFWVLTVFLIYINVDLFIKTQNYVILSIVSIPSIAYIGFRFKKLFLQNKNQDDDISSN